MKLLHIVHGYYPSIGGSQWLVQNLSEQLVTCYQDEVTVFTTVAYNTDYFWRTDEPALPTGVEIINGVVVRRFPVFNRLNILRQIMAVGTYRLHLPYNDWLRTFYNGPIIPGLRQAIAASDAEVMLATAFPLRHMYDALAGARRAHIPLVFLGAIHTTDVWGFDRPMIYRAIQQADAYIALTDFEKEFLITKGIEAQKILVAGGGVDPKPFLEATGDTARQRYGWGQDPVVGILAKQTPRKRFDVLIQAMPEVWAAYPQTRLLLAGAETPYTRKIQALIQELPVEQQARVTSISDVPETTKPGLLAACDIFALPSGEESLGIAFIEAWACGKPVIGSRIGAIPGVISDGRDGLLVDHGNPHALAQAILRLLAAPELRHQLGKAGREKVLEQYTWEAFAAQVRAIYTKLVRAQR